MLGGKIDVPTIDAIHLGIDDRRAGYLAFVPQWKRYTTFPFDDCQFFENDYPEFYANEQYFRRQRRRQEKSNRQS